MPRSAHRERLPVFVLTSPALDSPRPLLTPRGSHAAGTPRAGATQLVACLSIFSHGAWLAHRSGLCSLEPSGVSCLSPPPIIKSRRRAVCLVKRTRPRAGGYSRQQRRRSTEKRSRRVDASPPLLLLRRIPLVSLPAVTRPRPRRRSGHLMCPPLTPLTPPPSHLLMSSYGTFISSNLRWWCTCPFSMCTV